MVFSLFGANTNSLGSPPEVIAFDAEAGVFNYYASTGNGWEFHGNSMHAIQGGNRCGNCHDGGTLIMKELDSPWVHWEHFDDISGSKEFFETFGDVVGSRGQLDGASFESEVNRAAEEYTKVGRIPLLLGERGGEPGPTEDPASYMGAVVSASARKKIGEYIEIGKHEGKVLVSRLPENLSGHMVPLTIFRDIRPEHRIAQEEIFGPVLGIIRVKDFTEALAVANGTRYALTGGVYSRSPENIERARREFRVGNSYINRGCTGAIVERHPFGGFKMSGVGSTAGGPDYLQQFMVPRSIVENTMRRGFAPGEE
jgi:hypothetical protein